MVGSFSHRHDRLSDSVPRLGLDQRSGMLRSFVSGGLMDIFSFYPHNRFNLNNNSVVY